MRLDIEDYFLMAFMVVIVSFAMTQLGFLRPIVNVYNQEIDSVLKDQASVYDVRLFDLQAQLDEERKGNVPYSSILITLFSIVMFSIFAFVMYGMWKKNKELEISKQVKNK